MKLFEHLDFEQAIIRAAEHFRAQGLREAIIEKDYYVTEALRIIEQVAGGKVIFKGGDAGTFSRIEMEPKSVAGREEWGKLSLRG